MTLVFYPSLLHPLPIPSSLSSEINITQKLAKPFQKSIAPKSTSVATQFKLDIAQAAPTSESSESKTSEEEEEAVLDFFQMAMGALAGLVLFIFGVTRLSEGLEDLGTERMKNFL
ncbi:MAG: Na/Pi cotransporter family protein, partial [Waterburya sp.]